MCWSYVLYNYCLILLRYIPYIIAEMNWSCLVLLSDLQSAPCIAQMVWVPDQGISSTAGVDVASPASEAFDESTSTILAGSLFQSPIVLDTKEYLYELVLAPLVLNLSLWFAGVRPSAGSSPMSSRYISTWPSTSLNTKANLRSLWRSLRSFRPNSCSILVTFVVVLKSPLMKRAALRCIFSSKWVSLERWGSTDRGCVLHYGVNKCNTCSFFEGGRTVA